MPQSYEEAAELFEKGEIDYDRLRQVVAQLPPPVERRKAKNLADRYEVADEPYDKNSFFWIETLYLSFSAVRTPVRPTSSTRSNRGGVGVGDTHRCLYTSGGKPQVRGHPPGFPQVRGLHRLPNDAAVRTLVRSVRTDVLSLACSIH